MNFFLITDKAAFIICFHGKYWPYCGRVDTTLSVTCRAWRLHCLQPSGTLTPTSYITVSTCNAKGLSFGLHVDDKLQSTPKPRSTHGMAMYIQEPVAPLWCDQGCWS